MRNTMKTTYPLALQDSYYTCMANELILARQKTMSVWANRLINIVIMQLVAEDKDFKTYTVKIKDLANFVGLSTGNVYEDIKAACTEIMQTVVEIGTGNPKQPWELIHWMSLARYDGAGNITLSLSDEVKPYLLDLKSRGFFTQWQIKEILPMSSWYAIRLYQYITMSCNMAREYQTSLTLSVDFLRELLECQDKFRQIGEFKKGVIDTAVKQINNNPSTKHFIYPVEYIKTGRRVTHIKFNLHGGGVIRDVYMRYIIPREKGQNDQN